MDPSEEIKRLYFSATPKTIDRDLDRAIDLLRAMPDESARERLAVYMEGLAQMRSEARGGSGEGARGGAARPRGKAARPNAGGAKSSAPKARADRPNEARPRAVKSSAAKSSATKSVAPKSSGAKPEKR